jgi:hypothetical protein
VSEAHVPGSANGHAPAGNGVAERTAAEVLAELNASDRVTAHAEAAAEQETAGPRIQLTPASAIRIRPVRWLWADRIPAGAIALIPGREGIGKSLLLAWLTARITRGQLPGELRGQPRPVIYAASEDSWAHTIAPRLAAAGADLDQVYRVDVEHGDGALGHLTLPRDCQALAGEITRLGVAMLAADPLMSLIHDRINTGHDRELRTALEPLARLADQTGCAVVGLAHFNKTATTDALTLVTGSRAFAAVARAVLAVARDPSVDDGSCVLSQAKNNLGRLDLPSLRYRVRTAEVPTDEGPAYVGVLDFTGESERSVSDILSEAATDPAERSERAEAADWLVDYLTTAGGSAPRAEVAKAAREDGIAERTLKRARTAAKVTAERSGFPSTTVWRLPDDHAPSPPSPVGPHSAQSGQPPGHGPTGPTVAPLDDHPYAPSPHAAHQTTISDTRPDRQGDRP